MADTSTIKNQIMASIYRTLWEQQVIGGALMDAAFAKEQVGALTLDDFSQPSHQLIFGAMQTVVGKGGPLTVDTLYQYLESEFGLDESWCQYGEALLEALNLSNQQYVVAAANLRSIGA